MTAYEIFLNDVKNKDIAVIGMGVSNTPLIRLLIDAKAQITVHDKKNPEQLGDIYKEFSQQGVNFSVGENYLKNLSGDYIFRTPGMHPSQPELQKAKENGSIITSEMEVFFEVCPCPIIAITGSDGKTTTTTLTYEMLKASGHTCHLGGNIGKPLLADTPNMNKNDIAIVELSSFQLMTMQKSADISAITNVTPNHLDIHKDMDEYIWAKTNVFSHQKAESKLILNFDDEISKNFKPNEGVKLLRFSMKEPVINGVFLNDGTIYFAEDGKNEKIMDVGDIKIPGSHNIANYMTAIAITHGLCSFDDVRKVAREFGGVEHRIEFVRTLNGVKYYNDSIASSPTRTIAGLKSFEQKVILIAGGYDKHIPYDVLGPEIVEHVKSLVLVGATSNAIETAVKNSSGFDESKLEIFMENDFELAVRKAADISKEGDIVILSPASASFDFFKNFMERGERFKDIVNSL